MPPGDPEAETATPRRPARAGPRTLLGGFAAASLLYPGDVFYWWMD